MSSHRFDLVAFKTAVARVCEDLESRKDELSALDAAAGDGDMGISIANGARAVRASLEGECGDIGALLQLIAGTVEDEAGATIGALLSTGLMQAGRVVAGREVVELRDLLAMARAAAEGIHARGKADVGDRTLLDALIPAAEALQHALDAGEAPAQAVTSMLEAAEAGAQATASMAPRFGRARWMPERAIGHRDPGAVLVYRILKAAIG